MKLHLKAGIRTVSEANQREAWQAKARRVKDQRGAMTLALQAHFAPTSRVAWALGAQLVVLLTRASPKPLDDDNLRGALKAIRDAIAKWLGVDDRSPLVRWEYGQKRGAVREYAVEVEISGGAS